MTPRRWLWLGLAGYLAWALAYLVTGRLSDDGLHAYAARAVLHGQWPYRDFQYHQAPLLPLLLSLWFRVAGVGLLQARLFALLVSVSVVALTLLLARRAGAGERGLAAAAVALALSPSVALHLGYVQTQGLATLLALTAALLALQPGRAPRVAAWAVAGLATGARVSFAVLLVPLAWHAGRRDRATLALGLTAYAAATAAVFAPFAGQGLSDSLYLPFSQAGALVTERYTQLYLPVASPWEGLARRVGSWPNQLVYYAPLWLLVAFAHRRSAVGADDARGLVLATAIVLTLAHGVLPQRVNHSYLVVAMPFWAAWAAAGLGGGWRLGVGGWGRRAAALVLLAAVAAAVSRGVGRLDLSGGRTVLAEAAEVGRAVAAATPPDDTVLTFAAELAVAADRTVTPGLEPGYFAYYPNMTDAEAVRVHVMNPHRLLTVLTARQPDTLLLRAEDFQPLSATRHPWPDDTPLWQAVRAGYEPLRSWPAVGERRATMVLWRRR